MTLTQQRLSNCSGSKRKASMPTFWSVSLVGRPCNVSAVHRLNTLWNRHAENRQTRQQPMLPNISARDGP